MAKTCPRSATGHGSIQRRKAPSIGGNVHRPDGRGEIVPGPSISPQRRLKRRPSPEPSWTGAAKGIPFHEPQTGSCRAPERQRCCPLKVPCALPDLPRIRSCRFPLLRAAAAMDQTNVSHRRSQPAILAPTPPILDALRTAQVHSLARTRGCNRRAMSYPTLP
jgi:hypothetical protein